MLNEEKPTQLNLETVRAKLAQGDGKQFWRSLSELAETEEFESFLNDEFPQQARPLRMEMDRRQFMMLSGASLALAGLAGCRVLPQDKIVPYVKNPEDLVPGKALFYATTISMGGYGRGVLMESHEGRPTKLEGNPDHPSSLGKTDAIMQAATLTLYDPNRSQNIVGKGENSTWSSFLNTAKQQLADQRSKNGAGLRLLTETITSPTLALQINTLLAQFPQAKWIQYDSVNRDNAVKATEIAYGSPLNTLYRFDKADVVLSVDGDFLSDLPGSVRYNQDFSQKRRVRTDKTEMCRLYAVESTPTLVGGIADHKLPVRASDIDAFVRALAAKVGVAGVTGQLPASVSEKWLDAVAEDLLAAKGRSLVVPGERISPAIQALCHAINNALGNVGATVVYTDPIEARVSQQTEDLKALVGEMRKGKVEMLLIFGGNPVYTAPSDLNFKDQLTKVTLAVHLSLYQDETSYVCQWHIPEAHFLEAWGDIRGHDGTLSLVQPLIAPLYDNYSAHDVLAGLMDEPRRGYDLVKDNWNQTLKVVDFDKVWNRALHDGVLAGSASAVKPVTFSPNFASALPEPPKPLSSGDIEVVIAPDPTIWDGRYANNGWLQELPKPLTKTTWDNVILMSPILMDRLKIGREQVVEIAVKSTDGLTRTVRGAAWHSLGHPDNSVTVHLGYGRTRAGDNGTGCGFDANAIRTSDAMYLATGSTLKNIGISLKIATTENHHLIEESMAKGKTINDFQEPEREEQIIRIESLAEYRKPKEEKEPLITVFPEIIGGEEEIPSILKDKGLNGILKSDYDFNYTEFNRWGMAIDLNVCTGCNTCTLACQAENNIAVVGKDQVLRGREMHWIRIDRYYKGDIENPETYFMPMTCQHCEKAPCEPVCPVAATVHSHDGLNQMVYNRCVGTKYCSNNCPYKVRRFNFLNYANDFSQPVLKLVKNPDVTVRGRGVMEKCSFCVQRISRARIEAKKEGRTVGGNEVVTACQQACPTNAIIFGDLGDKESDVSKAKETGKDFVVLEELNTRPRLTYLPRVQNPNPKLKLGKE